MATAAVQDQEDAPESKVPPPECLQRRDEMLGAVGLQDGRLTGVAHGIPGTAWSVKTDSTCASIPGNYGHEVASFKRGFPRAGN
jgi:hypothetical protein